MARDRPARIGEVQVLEHGAVGARVGEGDTLEADRLGRGRCRGGGAPRVKLVSVRSTWRSISATWGMGAAPIRRMYSASGLKPKPAMPMARLM